MIKEAKKKSRELSFRNEERSICEHLLSSAQAEHSQACLNEAQSDDDFDENA